MSKWNVTVVTLSTEPDAEPVSTLWARGTDDLGAIQSVIQNMGQDSRWFTVVSVTVEPAPENQTPNAVAYVGAG